MGEVNSETEKQLCSCQMSEIGNEQMVFSSAVNKVVCNVCGTELAEPSGGKAKIKGEIVAVFE